MKPIKLFILIMAFSLITACSHSHSHDGLIQEWYEGELIHIKLNAAEELKFAFLDQSGMYHDNYTYAKNYRILISEDVLNPVLKYSLVYEVKGDTKQLVSPDIDSNNEIMIIMNRANHTAIFGQSDINLN